MNLECSHIMIASSDLARSRAFYADALELPVIEDHPAMFAVAAGSVRFTVTGGGHMLDDEPDMDPNTTLLLRTSDLEATVAELSAKGVTFLGEIQEAPGFMKHIALLDPDNNLLYIGQYLRDPLQPA
jgi:catechol 2,3-dioxygenase-like lactoylglutathione lyase family enzyme